MQSLGLISSSSTSSSSASSSAVDLVCHVNGLGQFTSDVADVVGQEAASRLVDQDILDQGGREIVSLLTELGALQKVQRYKHRYPYDWKTDKPVIVLWVTISCPPLIYLPFDGFYRATSQWFANLDNIKEDAVTALQDVSFFPTISEHSAPYAHSTYTNLMQRATALSPSSALAPSGVSPGSASGVYPSPHSTTCPPTPPCSTLKASRTSCPSSASATPSIGGKAPRLRSFRHHGARA